MNNYRPLAPAAYLTAAALVMFPLYDSAVNLVPWTLGSAQWRFGAIGVLSNTLMIVCLGALLAVGAAILSNQLRARRVLGAAAWVLALLLLLAIAAFAMDALQAGRQIRVDLLPAYRSASVTAELKLIVGLLTFALLARATRLEQTGRQDVGAGSPVLLGRQKSQL